MVVLIILIIIAWIIFSALLVTIICVNSSRLSQIQKPFEDPAYRKKEKDNDRQS